LPAQTSSEADLIRNTATIKSMPTARVTANPAVARSDPAGSSLVIFPGALGDLICLIPALRALARQHPRSTPDSTLELMARAELARFATGRLDFNSAHALGHSQRYSRGSSQGYSIDRREVAQLFAPGSGPVAPEARAFFGSFSHVYSFFGTDDEHFRAALEDASGGRASFFEFRPPGAGHVAAAYLRQIHAHFGSPAGAEPAAALDCSFELHREDLDLAEDRLAGLGLEPRRFILILPGSGSFVKNWPAENFAALAEALAARLRPLVILGPAEAALEPIFAARRLPLLSGLELAEVAALARLAAAFVGNDSGVSHLAAAAGAAGLAIFGPTDPERWRPLGRTTIIRREPLSALSPKEIETKLLETFFNE
jgi:Glycosyltransferase family 9 (heptosyltransferase)